MTHMILLITQDFLPSIGGVARYYAGVCSALPADQLTVLAPRTAYPDTHAYRILRRRFQWTWMWPRWLPLLWNTWRTIREVRPSEIWVGQVLPVGTVMWVLRRLALCNTPYAVFAHGMDILVPQSSPRKSRLMKRILLDASRVIANSFFVRDECIKLGIPSERIVIVHPCAEPRYKNIGAGENEFRTQQGLVGKTIILTVARLVPRKGVDLVLQALHMMTIPNCVYVVVGGGPERAQLEQYAVRNNLPVRFVGEVSDDELASWYAACDFFVLTPRRIGPDVEGFGMVYIEAGIYGKAVIGTRSGGIPDAVIDGVTGLLVDEDDQRALTQALQTLIHDVALRNRLGLRGKERAEHELQWAVQVATLRS